MREQKEEIDCERCGTPFFRKIGETRELWNKTICLKCMFEDPGIREDLIDEAMRMGFGSGG
jgi:hypothetical protein